MPRHGILRRHLEQAGIITFQGGRGMNWKRWIVGLAIIVVCLIGWAAHSVVGQPEPEPGLGAPPPDSEPRPVAPRHPDADTKYTVPPPLLEAIPAEAASTDDKPLSKLPAPALPSRPASDGSIPAP